MQETETETLTVIEVHSLCECEVIAFTHLPHQCQGEGDYTCRKCGKQVCDECYRFTTGLCMTCGRGQ